MITPKWLGNAVFYQIYPPSFYDSNGDGIGDIQGMIEKLDYVKDSGFNAIWLNPWFESAFRDGGYDITDFCKVDPRYGTNEDAQRFFRACHERGIHVILDLVVGHTAIEHPDFARSGELEPNDKTDMFIWSPTLCYRGDKNEADDYYVSGWSPRGAFKANFFAVQPAINYGFNIVKHPWEMHYNHPSCEKNRQMIRNVMRFWMDLGCDGFRVDMAHSVVKRDPDYKYTRKFWRETRKMFEKEYPEAALVSEWFNPAVSISGGFHVDFYGLNIFRNENWMNPELPRPKIVFDRDNHGGLAKWLKEYLRHYNSVKGKGYIGIFSGNHDTWRMRHFSTPRGMAVKLAFMLAMPGCPFIYYGDEIGMRYIEGVMTEGSDSRGGSRTPMQWTKGRNAGFSTAPAEKLYLPVDESADAPSVEEAEKGNNPLYNEVKSLIRLRLSRRALCSDGNLQIVHGKSGIFPLVIERSCGRDKVFAVFNPTGKSLSAVLPSAKLETLHEFHAARTGNSVALEPESFAFYAVQK